MIVFIINDSGYYAPNIYHIYYLEICIRHFRNACLKMHNIIAHSINICIISVLLYQQSSTAWVALGQGVLL